MAGDLDPQAVAKLLSDRLNDWVGNGTPRPTIVRPNPIERPKILLLDRPGASQAAVRLGHVGIHRLHQDYDALMLLNLILGGQFTSRLNAKLREEKGFTYGIRAHFDSRKGAGPFSIAASIQSDKVDEALDDIRGEVLGLLDNRPPTDIELEDAKRSLIEGQARHFETPSEQVSRYAALFLHDLPIDHHSRLADRLGAVTTDQLREVGPRHINPDALISVVVADASQVAGQLGALAWADLEVISV